MPIFSLPLGQRVIAIGLLLLSPFIARATAQQASSSAPVELLPPSLPVVAAIDRPVLILDEVLSLPWDELQEEIPALNVALHAPQVAAARAGLIWAESQFGTDYRQFFEVAAGGGIAVGVAQQNGLVLIARSPEPERLPNLLRAVTQLASGMTVGRDQPAPKPSASYRGVDAYTLGEVAVAIVGNHLMVCNQKELARATVDHILDGDLDSHAPRLPSGPEDAFRVVVRHSLIPNVQQAVSSAQGVSEDFGRELLLGGALTALETNGYSQAVAQFQDGELRVGFAMQTTGADLDDAVDSDLHERRMVRREIAGAIAHPDMNSMTLLDDELIPRLQLNGSAVAAFAMHRDFAQLWAEKSLLLNDNAAAQLDVADSQLSTAFGGFDFGEEVLSAISPDLMIVVYPPMNPESLPPVLPEAAAILPLRDGLGADVTRRFRIAWQTVIGLVNVQRGGAGQPQLELETSSEAEIRTVSGKYSTEDARDLASGSVDLYATLSPTLATSPSQIVIATSDNLARQAIRDAGEDAPESGGLISIAANGPDVSEILELNRAALVGQNMLEKGHSKLQAEQEIGTLLSIARLIRSVNVSAHPTSEGVVAQLNIQLQLPARE